MKCNHKDADGASSVINGFCGICGVIPGVVPEEHVKKNMAELQCYIEKIEAEKNRYLQETENLKEVIISLSKVI